MYFNFLHSFIRYLFTDTLSQTLYQVTGKMQGNKTERVLALKACRGRGNRYKQVSK